jgi:hypothetical protein
MSNCSRHKLEVPDGWSAEQAWAIVEFITILNESIWDTYETKLLDHARRKPPPTYDKNETAVKICLGVADA